MSGSQPAADPAEQWWARSRRGWHALFGVVLATCFWILRQDDAPDWTFGVLTVLGIWYLVAGARVVHHARQLRASPWPYLIGAGLLTCVLAYADADTLILLFTLYPQVFALLRSFRDAVVAAGLLTVGVAVALAASGGWRSEAIVTAGLHGAVNFAFALVIGGIIEVLVREMDRRGTLLAEITEARAELDAAHREAGALAERERLAGEIHDTLAQGFTSILMLAQAAEATADDPALVRTRLSTIERTARENLAEARALVAAMEPVALQEGTLMDAVGRLVDRFGPELGIETGFAVKGEARALDSHRQVVLLRAAQEGLANVRKHAGARHVDVELAFLPGGVTRLRVCDDGDGLREGAAPGWGLRGMRSRVEQSGGVVSLTTRSAGGPAPPGTGQGATLEVTLP